MSADAATFVNPDAHAETTPAPAEPGFKVFAGNLTYATDEAALTTFFADFAADILSTQIIFHGPRSAGYGFVTFKEEAAIDKAIEALDKKDLDGRPVIVERAKPIDTEKKPRRKFGGRRGNKDVPGEASEVKTDAEGGPATVPADGAEGTEKRKKKRNSKKRKGKKPAADGVTAEGGEVTAADGEVTDGAAAGERTRKPRKPRGPKRPRGEAPTGDPSKSILFVANLAYSVDEPALTEFFAENGINIKSARVVRWRWGTPRKSKGYAFVDVGDEAEQGRAIEAVQGKSIADREVTVKIAVNSKHDEEGGGGAEGGEVVPAPAAELPVVAIA